MKKFIVAGASAIALAATATPAHAVVDLDGGTPIALTDLNPAPLFFNANDMDFFALGGTLPVSGDGLYSLTFSFPFPQAGTGAGSVSSSLVGGSNLLFSSVTLNGFAWALSNGGQTATLGAAPVVSPTNFVEVVFSVADTALDANFNGQVSATAVPEPMTWALMILGFAGIGVMMRRRKSVETRVRYAM